MRKLLITAAIVGCGAVLAVTRAVASDTPAPSTGATLTGEMAKWQFLVGTWTCTVKIAATQGESATTDQGILTYDVVAGNALHSHVTAKDYASDNYVGYVDKAKIFWMNTIDAYGNLSGETSSDGKVFTGSSKGAGSDTPIRDTLSHPTPTTIRDYQEFKTDGAWHMASDATCTRS